MKKEYNSNSQLQLEYTYKNWKYGKEKNIMIIMK